MASQDSVKDIVSLLYQAPLANKPKPLPGKTERDTVENLFRIFYLALQDIDDELLKVAVIQHISTEKWFPTVADIRTAAVSLLHRADDVPDPYTAWASVKRWLNRGPEPHPLAVRAIDTLGGIKEYGQSDVNDEGQWRARFIMAYETLQRRQAENDMMLPQIAGYIEKRKELNGESVGSLIAETTKKLMANSRQTSGRQETP